MVRDFATREPRERPPVPFPARKPLHRARRISLFDREIRVTLSAAAIDILFHDAALLSEGCIAGGWYGGSSMLTIDLGRAAHVLSEACDAVTARQLETLCIADPRVHERARAIALAEAEARAGIPLGRPSVDVRIHRTDRLVHIDVDIEAPVPETP